MLIFQLKNEKLRKTKHTRPILVQNTVYIRKATDFKWIEKPVKADNLFSYFKRL